MKIPPANPGPEVPTTQNAPKPAPENTRPVVVNDRWERAAGPTMVETQYSVDQATHQMVVQVRDSATNQVIRELPPEQVRALSESIRELVGRLMDKKA